MLLEIQLLGFLVRIGGMDDVGMEKTPFPSSQLRGASLR